MAMLSHNPNILFATVAVVVAWIVIFQPLSRAFPDLGLLFIGLWLLFTLAAFLFFLMRIWGRK
jgi:hypothetical protein